MESGFPSKTFSGIRFALVGFNLVDGNTLRSKLLSGGGVDVGQYCQSCTHLIVDKLLYDDPICVTARSNGKVVVTGSWVDHSFDIGMLIDTNSVLYRPLRDLNGIQGAKDLIVCLTGYQRQDREDIMTMVDLMGGQFSKPLVANRVTHLICYKFEGEKYELAKRMKRIKLVNHRWLEDCLKNWKLLPEAEYEISGYELEMMEASARDSEDEAEDATVKRANNSPLGLRVGAAAVVESGGKDIQVVQRSSGAQGGSSSKENWLTPKKIDIPLEANVSTDGVNAQQHNYQRASTFQDTSIASPNLVDKTSELGKGRVETDDTTSVNMSIRRHSSLATYSRKKSPETSTLGKDSSGQNGFLKMDDRGLNASTASKSGSFLERTTLFKDLDKIDKLHSEEPPWLLPQVKFTDGSVSSKGSQKVHHNSEASIPPLASSLLQELRPGSPKENLRPVPSINDPTEIEEVGYKSQAVPMKDDMSTASKCASDEIAKRSSTEPTMIDILLQVPRSSSPKQNLSVVPNISDQTEGREVERKLDVSDSATKLLTSSVVPVEADMWNPENTTLKGALDEVQERSITEPVVKRANASPRSGLIEMKEKLETDLAKKKTAPKKTLGTTRGRKKSPINQKGSIYLSKSTSKDEHTEVSAPVADDSNQKENSSPVVNTEAVPEMAKHIDSETEAPMEIDSVDNKSSAPEDKDHCVDLIMNLDKTRDEADAEVEVTMLEPELKDVSTKYTSDGALQVEVDNNKSKRKRVASEGKNSLQSGKKESSSKAEIGKSSAKKTRKSRKEDDAKENDTVMKDLEDCSMKEKDNIAMENKSEKDCLDGDQSLRKEAETKDQSDAAAQLEADKSKGKHIKEATVEKNKLQSGKKRSSSTVKLGKPTIKKAKANNADMKDAVIDSAEAKKNVAVDKKSEDVSSDGAQSLAARKTLPKKEAAVKDPSNAAMQLEVDKDKRKHEKESTEEKSSIQRGKKGSSSTVEVGKSNVKKSKKSKGGKATDTEMKDIENNTAEEKENIAVSNKSDKETSPVSGKPLARKKTAKSADKESKQLNSKPLTSKKVLPDQEQEPKFFIVSGLRLQRKEYQQIIKSLKGKCCRDSHQWSYQATHFIATEIRRTEKFFAAAASGSWILKTDYVADSKEAGKLLAEEPYEWYGTSLSADGAISLESPRKWRLLREQTGHGALYGMRIVVYGDCTIPSLDTLKRAVKAGDGSILATAPPYTRFLNENTDFAVVSPTLPRDDVWIQEFIRHQIPCVLSDYIVEYVCKPGYALDKHVLFDTTSWAERSYKKIQLHADVSLE